MKRFFFSFGHGHYDDNHESLFGYYTEIAARSESAARVIMSAKRGVKWCWCYASDTEILKKEMKLIPFDELTAQN